MDAGFEGLALLFFNLMIVIASYFYYRSAVLNGEYGFYNFLYYIFLPTFLISTPVLILARIYSSKLLPIQTEAITIKGENKLDVLKIRKNELVCVSSSQNYVEIYYLQKNELQKKLIRSSLTVIQKEFDFLIKVHRSHLINPTHFKAWKNQNAICLTQMEIPVSKNYRAQILSL